MTSTPSEYRKSIEFKVIKRVKFKFCHIVTVRCNQESGLCLCAYLVHLVINSLDGPGFARLISVQSQWTDLTLDETEWLPELLAGFTQKNVVNYLLQKVSGWEFQTVPELPTSCTQPASYTLLVCFNEWLMSCKENLAVSLSLPGSSYYRTEQSAHR